MLRLGSPCRDGMHVEIDRWSHQHQTGETSLLARLPQGNRTEITLAVGVSTRLEPPLQFGVMEQEHLSCVVVDDERGAGEVTGQAGPDERIRMFVEKRQHLSSNGWKRRVCRRDLGSSLIEAESPTLAERFGLWMAVQR